MREETIEREVKRGFSAALAHNANEATLATWLLRYPEWEGWLRHAYRVHKEAAAFSLPTVEERARAEAAAQRARQHLLAERSRIDAQEAPMRARLDRWRGELR